MDQNQNNSDLDKLVKYSDSLSKSADALLKASQGFQKASNDWDKNSKDNNKKFTKDMTDVFEKNSDSINKTSNNTKAYGQAFLKSLKTIGSYFIKDLTNAYSKVNASFEANLTRITTSYQITNREYADMLNKMTSDLRSAGLSKQFSQIDWSDKLLDVLSQGIRNVNGGTQAQDMAYRNMIANKLLPALQTNTRTYVRMTKTFGEKFDQNMVAFGKYTESILGAQAHETGTIQAILEQYEVRLRGLGLGTEGTNKIINEMTAAAEVALNRGASESHILKAYSDIYESLTTFNTSNLAMLQAGGTTPEKITQMLKTPGGFTKLLSNYVGQTASYGSGNQTTNAILANALGYGSSDFALELSMISEGFADEVEKVLRDYEAKGGTETYYNKLLQSLKNGDYASTTSKYENWMMNTVSPVANTLSLWLPNSASTLTAIGSILGLWFKSWLNSEGSSGSSSLLKKFLSHGGGIGGAGGALIGGASLAAGLIWSGVDAYRGVSSASSLGTGGKVLSGIRGALTGRTYSDPNSKFLAALSGEKTSFDWGSMFANAGKGALLGAGIGTASAGWAAGSGTVIGAAIGGVSAGVTNAIDQLIENAKYNKLADATSELTESLSNLTTATSEYTTVLDKNKELEESLGVLQNKSNKGTQAYSKALDTILKYYPEYTESIKKSGEASETILSAIENYADYERLVAQNNLKAAAEDARSKRSAYTTASNQFAEVLKEDAGYSLASQIFAGMTEDELGEAISSVAAQFGITEKDVVNAYNKISYDTDERNWFQKLFNPSASIGVIDGKYNITKTQGSHTIGAAPDRKKDPRVASERSRVNQALQFAMEEYQTYISRLKYWGYNDEEENGNLVNDIREFVLSNKSAAREARTYHGIEYNDKMPFTIISENPEILAAFGGQPPRFKVGAYSIASDDTPALLHSGEMVLTSTDANALRELASAQGIRGLLSGLLAITHASATAVDETSAATNPIVEAIQSQTNILSAHLINILEEVKEIKSNTKVHGSGSTISRDLITYQGV